MQNARIFLVEDDRGVAKILREYLTLNGHQIVLYTKDLEGVLEIVNSGKLEQEKINLAIVDGYFPESPTGPTKFCGPDVADAIKKTGLPIKIIAHSASPEYYYGDVFVRKAGADIVKVISKL